MFGIKALRARIMELEQARFSDAMKADPESTIEIPIVNALGEPVRSYTVFSFPYKKRKMHTITVQEAFDKLQAALGVELTMELGTKPSVKVYGE